jgi:hypothetical protein
MSNEKIHKFELAGLGKAPFRYTGWEERRGPIAMADGTLVGAPGQPMGTCDYCGQGIAICCHILSSDGRAFIVGSDCVAKTGDAGLKRIVKQEDAKRQRERRCTREGERIIDAKRAFVANRSVFEAMPHPRGFKNRDTGEPLTMADQIDWMLRCAGHTGKYRTARNIERILGGATR